MLFAGFLAGVATAWRAWFPTTVVLARRDELRPSPPREMRRLFGHYRPEPAAYLNGSELMILRSRNAFCAATIGSLTVATVSRKYCNALVISTLVAFET